MKIPTIELESVLSSNSQSFVVVFFFLDELAQWPGVGKGTCLSRDRSLGGDVEMGVVIHSNTL